MPPRVANLAPCITQVTFKLVHYALLINQLRLNLTFFKVFQLRLNNVSGVLVLEEYDYSGYVISRQFSRSLQWLLVSNSRVGKGINGRGHILVSYDVSSLFTNVPLDETIAILTEKAFRDNWFNSTYNLNISKLKKTLLIC